MDINHYKSQLNITNPHVKYSVLKRLTTKILKYLKAFKVEFYINNILIIKKVNNAIEDDSKELLDYEYLSNDRVYKFKIYIYSDTNISKENVDKITDMINHIQIVNLDALRRSSTIYYIFFKKTCIYSSNTESISHPMKEFEHIILNNIYNINGLTYRVISYSMNKFTFLQLIDITYSFELLKTKQSSYEQEIRIMNSNYENIKKHLYNIFQYLEQLNDTGLSASQKHIFENTTISAYSIIKIITDSCDYIKYELGTFDKIKYSVNINKSFGEIVNALTSITKTKNVAISKNIDLSVPSYIIENPTLFKDLFLNLCLFGLKGMDNGSIDINTNSRIIKNPSNTETTKYQLSFRIIYYPMKNPEELLTNITNGFHMIISKRIIKYFNSEITIPKLSNDRLEIDFKIETFEDKYIREYSYLIEYLSNKTYLINGVSDLKPFVESTLFKYKIQYTYDPRDKFDYILSLNNTDIISDKKQIKIRDIYFNENKFIAELLRTLDTKDAHILTCDDNAVTSSELKIKLNNLGYFNVSVAYSIKECLNTLKDKNIKILFLDEKVNNYNFEKIIKKIIKSTMIPKPKLIITARQLPKNCPYPILLKPYDQAKLFEIMRPLLI